MSILLQQQYPQLFQFWNELNVKQKDSLLYEIKNIDQALLFKQQQLLKQPQILPQEDYEACQDFAYSGCVTDQLTGQQLLSQGKVGCIILAGGQGTRLQFDGPKGVYPISIIKKKSLFQLFAEKTVAASELAGRPLPLAIMTSGENDQATRQFFEKNSYFDLEEGQVVFFKQAALPFLNDTGNLFLHSPYQIACGPNGNGQSISEFVKAGVHAQWTLRGVEYLNVILIDNPLADPFDAELVGFHHRQQVQITLKGCERKQPYESVGIIVKQQSKHKVVEYSEMSQSERLACQPNGQLKHLGANLSLFCFSMSFIAQNALNNAVSLPLHKAWKSTWRINAAAQKESLNAWKFEFFIFEWLAFAQRVAVLLYPRAQCFAPLKNLEGQDTPSHVQKALQEADVRALALVSGQPSPTFPFELAAAFHYPTAELKARWLGKKIASAYVDK